MKGKHFAKPEKKKLNTKSIILSAVAMLEFLLLAVSVSFAWFEGVTSLEISGNNIATPTSINSHVVVGENSSESDTTFNQIIDLTSFYEEQNDVRLSPVSSADGINFYAPYEYTSTSNFANAKYRKMSQEDINANIIRFEFTISSPSGPTDIYLSEILPQFELFDTVSSSAARMYAYRFAYSDGTTTHILSTRTSNITTISSIDYLNADDTAHTVTGRVKSLSNYIYKSDHSTANNVLFHLEKNETKTITFSLWLDALDEGWTKASTSRENPARDTIGEKVAFIAKLCTTWSIPRTITVYDYTATQWVNTEDTVQNDNDMILYARNADGSGNLYPLAYSSSAKSWTGEIPMAVKNLEFLWISSSDSNRTPHVTWRPANRGDETVLTLLGSSTAVWGLEPSELTKIDFRDYTNDSWVNNKDDKGNDINMDVRITYNGSTLEYSMTDTFIRDEYNKSTWSCWIPSSVDFVRFNRSGKNSENKDTLFNYWNGANRGSNTVYRAIDSGTTVEDTTYKMYLEIDESLVDTFFYNNHAPALSFTSDNNRDVINAVNGAYNTLSKDNYIPSTDSWPIGDSRMTQVTPGDNTLWYINLSSQPQNGDLITIWNRTANGFNTVDQNQSFGMITYNSSYNTIKVTAREELTSQGAINNHYLTLEQTSNTNTSPGDTSTSQSKLCTGVWGELTLSGPAVNFKHYDTSVSTMSARFTYDNTSYSVPLTKGTDNLTWTTSNIPDGASSITFTDGTNTWSTSGRSTYCYALDKNTAEWSTADNLIRIYFTDNWDWDNNHSIHIHYWGGDSPTSWPGNAMTYIGKNDQKQTVYCALVPANSTGIIFNNNNNGIQTSNITSNITDMKGFYISSGSGTAHKTGTWNVDAQWIKDYSE